MGSATFVLATKFCSRKRVDFWREGLRGIIRLLHRKEDARLRDALDGQDGRWRRTRPSAGGPGSKRAGHGPVRMGFGIGTALVFSTTGGGDWPFAKAARDCYMRSRKNAIPDSSAGRAIDC